MEVRHRLRAGNNTRIGQDAWNDTHAVTGTPGKYLRFDDSGLASEADISLAAMPRGLRPEDFGAKGDGKTNDTAAFALLNAFIEIWSGGFVEGREGATYIVGGRQDRPYILDFSGCTRPVLFRGNGATIKTEDGQRYGVFNAVIVTPFYGIIRATGCSGGVRIENLNLPGNSANIELGEKYGDNDWQIACSGIQLGHWEGPQNTCSVELVNVRSADHCLDGLVRFEPGTTDEDPIYPLILIDCEFDGNSRQAFSWVGGKGVAAVGCKFNNTGRGKWASAPKCGMDIEEESAVCRDGLFVRCEFVNNLGPAVNGYGNNDRMRFQSCRFIGTTAPSLYGFGKFWTFDDCQITGQMVNVWPSDDPNEATKFTNCRFLFGKHHHPSGKVYAPAGHMADFGGRGAQNVLMQNCLFDTEGNSDINLSYLSEITFRDCTLKQDGAGTGVAQYTIWEGVNTIETAGWVDLYYRDIRGSLTANGETVH